MTEPTASPALARVLPTGTVTFMFTDIEGSTRLLQSLGDRYPGLLATHHALMRRAIQSNEGIEVNTEGDAFFAVFTTPQSAVVAAAEAQRSLDLARNQLAYAELYFTDTLWPDFSSRALDEAFESYRSRERRFGAALAAVSCYRIHSTACSRRDRWA